MDVEACFRCTLAVKQFQSFGFSNRIFHGTLLVSSIGDTLGDLNTTPPVLVSSTRNSWLVIKKLMLESRKVPITFYGP